MKITSNAKRAWKSSVKGKESFYAYYCRRIADWNGIERREGNLCHNVYHETLTIMRQGKLSGCRL